MKTLNSQALKHPTTQDKIITGLITAYAGATQSPEGRGVAYVHNSKGLPLFRLDVYAKPGQPFEVAAYRGNANIVGAVSDAMGVPLAELLA